MVETVPPSDRTKVTLISGFHSLKKGKKKKEEKKHRQHLTSDFHSMHRQHWQVTSIHKKEKMTIGWYIKAIKHNSLNQPIIWFEY